MNLAYHFGRGIGLAGPDVPGIVVHPDEDGVEGAIEVSRIVWRDEGNHSTPVMI